VQIPGVKIHTPISPAWSGAIALFSIEGWKPSEIDSELFKKWGIHCVAIDWENIHGVRITPHVYTLESDLDRLLDGIRAMAGTAPGR
jgi:selenocysteine lyase/cysteine desulfurase